MNKDPASLDNLQDIAVPPPVTWWPPAVGWWIVFAVLAIVAFVALVLWWRRWRANAYRRAALHEIASTESVFEVAEILKRTAMCAFPREEVASLSGGRWIEWLATTSPQKVPEDVGQALTRGVFSEDTSDLTKLKQFAQYWILNHASTF